MHNNTDDVGLMNINREILNSSSSGMFLACFFF